MSTPKWLQDAVDRGIDYANRETSKRNARAKQQRTEAQEHEDMLKKTMSVLEPQYDLLNEMVSTIGKIGIQVKKPDRSDFSLGVPDRCLSEKRVAQRLLGTLTRTESVMGMNSEIPYAANKLS